MRQLRHVKRFIVDAVGNYVFFVPLVVLLNQGWSWPGDLLARYLLSSVLLCSAGRAFSLFLKHAWYPLWREEF